MMSETIIEVDSLTPNQLPRNKIIHGYALEALRKLPSDSVDCVITSPPYWKKREYKEEANKIWGGDPSCDHEWGDELVVYIRGVQGMGITDNRNKVIPEQNVVQKMGRFCKKCGAWFGQLGMEPTPEMFVDHLIEIFREVYRVLKPTGNLFVVIDDTWVGGGHGSNKVDVKDPKYGVRRNACPSVKWPSHIKRQSLALVPELFAVKMVYDVGFILRSKIVWAKKVLLFKDRRTVGNAMPEPVKSRLAHAWEYIYHFTKIPSKYYFKPFRTPLVGSLSNKSQEASINGEESDDVGSVFKVPKSSKFIENMDEIGSVRSPAGRLAILSATGQLDKKTLIREAIDNVNAYLLSRLKAYMKANQITRREALDRLSEMTGIKKTTLEHYFRTDLSGAAIPDRKAWERLKPILGLDDYEKHVKEIYRSVIPSPHPYGSNSPDVVQINLKPFRGAHFAVFPPDLVRFLMDIGCPELVCSECGRPYLPVYEPVDSPGVNWRFYGADENGEYRARTTKEYGTVPSPKEVKERILNTIRTTEIEVGIRPSCDCNSPPDKPIVLDPFLGSGTTAVVAKEMRRDFIGIEVVRDYCEIAEKRLEGVKVSDRIDLWLS